MSPRSPISRWSTACATHSKIYSGGLGVLAGDYIKEASDSCVDMTAVGFLYRYGYFTQTLSVDGQQIANYEPQNFNQLPIEQVCDANGRPVILEVPLSRPHSLQPHMESERRPHESLPDGYRLRHEQRV